MRLVTDTVRGMAYYVNVLLYLRRRTRTWRRNGRYLRKLQACIKRTSELRWNRTI